MRGAAVLAAGPAGKAALTGNPLPIILPSSYFEAHPADEGFDEGEADMETTRLSTKGQVIIPKDIRDASHWRPGQELEVRVTREGVLLKAPSPFPETRLDDVAGCMWRPGMKAKSVKEISRLSARAIREAMDAGRR